MVNDITNLIKAGLIGFAIGDAIGVPVEFMSRDEIKENPVKDMLEYGTHHQPKGTWSDDSSLTFCLVEALTEGYDLKNIGSKFVQWYRKGYWTAHGNVFDIGNGTRNAIMSLECGIEPTKAGGASEFNNGNGSLMRVLPLAFYLMNEENLDKKFKIIEDVSSLTHGHIVSKLGCSIYVEMLINLLKGNSKFEAYEKTVETILKHYSNSKYLNAIKKYSRILNINIHKLSEDEIESSGYVIHTLEATFWCFLKNENFEDTVLKAVNLGDDTDTTGAVAGGMAGMYYGLDSIRGEWVTSIVKVKEIEKLAENFTKAITNEV